jgi:hypothetical protein
MMPTHKANKVSSFMDIHNGHIKETSNATAGKISSIVLKNVQHTLERGSARSTNTPEKLSFAIDMHDESIKERSSQAKEDSSSRVAQKKIQHILE